MRNQLQTTDARLADIGDLAEFIAEDYFPDGNIMPETIIDKNGITLSLGDYSDAFDGLLEHQSGRFHIYCNVSRLQHNSRIRFTLAHELAHFFIPEHRQALESGLEPHASFSEYQSQNPVEHEADHFASNMLMPRVRFCEAAKKMERGLSAVLALADLFETSWTSTVLRYVKLNVLPCAMIKWNADGTTWRRFSDSAFRSGFRKISRDRNDVPSDSPTGKLFLGKPTEDGPFFAGVTVASQWFPFLNQGDPRDILIIEQAISLGDFGYLTFIIPKSGTFDR